MHTDVILDQIDAALDDWSVGPDAMRSAPGTSRTGPREVLIRRLMERHGLNRMTARHAVIAAEQGRTSEHAGLVQAEVRAVAAVTMQQLREAFRPMAERMTEAFKQLAEAFRQLQSATPTPAPGRRQDRPAWQSPYGPANRRRPT